MSTETKHWLHALRLGSEVYLHGTQDSRHQGRPSAGVVVKVGTRYVYIARPGDEERKHCWLQFDRSGFVHSTEYPHVRVWQSEEDYAGHKERSAYVRAIVEHVRMFSGRLHRDAVPLESLKTIAELLGIEVKS